MISSPFSAKHHQSQLSPASCYPFEELLPPIHGTFSSWQGTHHDVFSFPPIGQRISVHMRVNIPIDKKRVSLFLFLAYSSKLLRTIVFAVHPFTNFHDSMFASADPGKLRHAIFVILCQSAPSLHRRSGAMDSISFNMSYAWLTAVEED